VQAIVEAGGVEEGVVVLAVVEMITLSLFSITVVVDAGC
jgi:hypothetical protein